MHYLFLYLFVGMVVTLLSMFALTLTGQTLVGVLRDYNPALEDVSDWELELKFTVLAVLLWPVLVYGSITG